MTASLVPCPRKGCTPRQRPQPYASPAEKRNEQPVYWDADGIYRVCALCGWRVVEFSGKKVVPTEVAAAFRLGGVGAVGALVWDHSEEYPDLHRRLVRLSEA